ncbi:MAG: hypothetical protein Q9227_002127 [Pyrenula ochraceoflavens]
MPPAEDDMAEAMVENEILKATTENLQKELIKTKVALQKEQKKRQERSSSSETLVDSLRNELALQSGQNTTFHVEHNGETYNIDMSHDDMVSVVQQGLQSSGFTKVTAEGYENRLPISVMPKLQEIKGQPSSPVSVRFHDVPQTPLSAALAVATESTTSSLDTGLSVTESGEKESTFGPTSSLRATARSFYPDPANKFLNDGTGRQQPRQPRPRVASPPPEDLLSSVISKHREQHAAHEVKPSTPPNPFNFEFLDGSGSYDTTSPKTLKLLKQFGIGEDDKSDTTAHEATGAEQEPNISTEVPVLQDVSNNGNAQTENLLQWEDEPSRLTIIPNSEKAAAKASAIIIHQPEILSPSKRGRTVFVTQVPDYYPEWKITSDNPIYANPMEYQAARRRADTFGDFNNSNFWQYGLRYTELGANAYRTVMILDIPPTTTAKDVLSVVRGGALERVSLVKSPIPRDDTLTARIVFLWEASALNFMNHVRDVKRTSAYGTYQLAGSPVHVVHITVPTYPTPADLLQGVFSGKYTRVLAMEGVDMEAARAMEVFQKGAVDFKESIEGAGDNHDEKKMKRKLVIEYMSIRDAVIAGESIRRERVFAGVEFEYGPDPCDWV